MALKFDSNGWLIPGSDPKIDVNIEHRTSKTMPLNKTLLGGKPVGIIWHWTGGGFGDGKARFLEEWTVGAAVKPEPAASWHFYITKNGKLYQHAPLTIGTWHAGAPPGNKVFIPVKGDVGTMVPLPNINTALLGVEMENAGILKSQKLADGKTAWYAWPYGPNLNTCTGKAQCSEVDALRGVKNGARFGEKYRVTDNRVIQLPNGKAYDAYTQAQIKTATELSRALKEALGWVSPKQLHYSHEQFLPTQKLDPGDVWMEGILPQIEVNVFGRRADGRGVSIDATAVVLGLAALGGAYWYWRRRSRDSGAMTPALPAAL